MFDTYRLTTERVFQHCNTSVVEKRASTDESVKLLKEFEDAAEKRILDMIKFGDNEVRGIMVAKAISPEKCFSIDYHYRFTLNGKLYENKINIDNDRRIKKDEHYVELVKLLSDQIALDILGEVLKVKP